MYMLLMFLCLFISCGTNNGALRQERQSIPAVPYFLGEGGKDKIVAVFAPTGQNFLTGEEWILPLIQGCINTDFMKYSAIRIIDRQNLDKVLQAQNESMSGNYSDDDYVRIGHLTNAKLILTGNLTRTPSGSYMLELSVINIETGERAASYGPVAYPRIALENFTAIRAAEEELLKQLGVQLSGDGIAELRRKADTNFIEAETALSKAIVAQNKGTTVEALTYLYQAAGYNPSLQEVNNRLSLVTSELKSGNIGANVRNEIQLRNEWKKILDEAVEFYQNHLPFEIAYNTELSQGNINYTRETVDLSFTIRSEPIKNGFKALEDILDGLTSTGKREEWGFGYWPMDTQLIEFVRDYTTTIQDRHKGIIPVKLDIALLNDDGKEISRQSIVLTNDVSFVLGTAGIDWYSRDNYTHWGQRFGYGWIYLYDTTRFQVVGDSTTVSFGSVNANDITDNLLIKVISCNGIDAETASGNGYIRIYPNR